MDPQTQPTAPAPSPAAAPAPVQSVDQGKVSINPFAHLVKGTRNLFSTNLGTALAASAIAIITAIGTEFAFAYFVLRDVGTSDSSSASGIVSLLGGTLAFIVLLSLIMSYLGTAVTRTILTGARKQKVSLADAFGLARKRFLKVVATYLFMYAVYIGGIIVVALSALAKVPALTILLGLGFLIFILVYIFRIAYTMFVMADDAAPGSPLTVIKRSTALWKKSGGALILYIIMIIVTFIVVSSLSATANLTKTDTTPTAYQPTSDYTNLSQDYPTNNLSITPAKASVVAGSVVISAVVFSLIGIIQAAGMADIYNDARQIVDGAMPPAPAAAAPPPPVAQHV